MRLYTGNRRGTNECRGFFFAPTGTPYVCSGTGRHTVFCFWASEKEKFALPEP